MLLITRADSHLGRLVVDEVLRRAPEAPLAVSVEDRAAVGGFAALGVEVRHAEYSELLSVAAALDGVDRMLLMPSSTPTPRAFVSEMRSVALLAAEEGITHIVYPDISRAEGLDRSMIRAHAHVSELIQATGVATTLLRANLSADLLANEVSTAIAAGELAAPLGEAQVALVPRTDIAAAIATVLLEDGHAAGSPSHLVSVLHGDLTHQAPGTSA